MAASRLAVKLGSPEFQTTTVEITDVTGTAVSIEYATLPGNQPKTYGNFVAIWEATVIPWTVPPLKREDIPQNGQMGSFVLSGLAITQNAFIVGYGVGPEISNICASALISAGGLRAAPTSIQLGINSVGTNSVSVHYSTLAGYRPHTYENWIGLWRGYVSPYNAPAPVGRVDIPTDSTIGDVGINGVNIVIDSVYTLIYFMGKEETTAAATLTFETTYCEACEEPIFADGFESGDASAWNARRRAKRSGRPGAR